jgi:hypothetical protein
MSHATSAPATSAMAPMPTACFRNVHSSRWRRGGGLSLGLAFGVLEVGSSMVMRCGLVHSVISSPLARATVIGSGGNVS